MAIVSVAITMSFHVKHQPTDFELRMARPLGGIFWALSVMMLLLGLGNYIRMFSLQFSLQKLLFFSIVLVESHMSAGTVNQYSRKVAIVQTGLKTQLVSFIWLLTLLTEC